MSGERTLRDIEARRKVIQKEMVSAFNRAEKVRLKMDRLALELRELRETERRMRSEDSGQE